MKTKHIKRQSCGCEASPFCEHAPNAKKGGVIVTKKLYRYSDGNTYTDGLTLLQAQKFQRQQNGGSITPMTPEIGTVEKVLNLNQAEVDALGEILDLAHGDQENYMNVGSPKADYGDEWPAVAGSKAERFRLMATIGEKLGLHGERERWSALADAMDASAKEFTEGGDDLCDLCMSSGVQVARTTHCGKTIGECCDKDNDGTCGDPNCEQCREKAEPCPNCGTVSYVDDLKPIQDLHERVAPGESMPAGECPECGALCQAVQS